MLTFVTVYHDACIENLLLGLILFTFRIKLKAPLRQMSDFTLSPPYLNWQQFYVMPAPLVFQPPLQIIIAQSLISTEQYVLSILASMVYCSHLRKKVSFICPCGPLSLPSRGLCQCLLNLPICLYICLLTCTREILNRFCFI